MSSLLYWLAFALGILIGLNLKGAGAWVIEHFSEWLVRR